MIPLHARQTVKDHPETFGGALEAVMRMPLPEADFSSMNLWDKLDMDTREAVALAAGLPAEFAATPWAQMSRREQGALKRVWDTAVGEQVG